VLRFPLDVGLTLKLILSFFSSRKLACSIGLETGFFSDKKAHRILNTFNGYHVNQLRAIGQHLVSEFGEASAQEVIVVDIDQSARPTYARKREGATTGKTSKRGQNCLQWSVAFCAGEVIDQELKEGYRHCIDDLSARYLKALKVLGHIDLSKHRGWIFKCFKPEMAKKSTFLY